MYEHKSRPPIQRRSFAIRLATHLAAVLALLVLSLLGGMAGYMAFEGMGALDAFLNAAMLLGGMGPVNMPVTNAGKLFAGMYALYAGLVFIVSAAMIFTPVVHRLLHLFHWDEKI